MEFSQDKRGARTRRLFALQEAAAVEPTQEVGERLLGQFRAEMGLGETSDLVEGSRAVELPQNELLDLAEPKKLTADRILDDDKETGMRPMLANDQVAPEFRKSGIHSAVGQPTGTSVRGYFCPAASGAGLSWGFTWHARCSEVGGIGPA